MSDEQLKQLIRKANQIALNYAALADSQLVATKVYEHLVKFWSPLMKQQIREYVSNGQGELNSEAYLAVQRL